MLNVGTALSGGPTSAGKEDGTTDTTPHLRAQPTRPLGREGDLEQVLGLLLREGVRLLTLTGPAGVGKTRLALEAGGRVSGDFAEGPVFADLSLVRESSRVPRALARAVGLRDAESPRLTQRLFAYLRERRSLVILDNFEQVLPAASWLADLLATCPDITLLVTSREPLRLRWERTYRVAPLALPDPDHLPPPQELAGVPSVALFVERARAVDAGFALDEGNARAVAELCARLDGLPLAIELAAARTGVLSPRMVLERLGERLSLLRWEARDLPERQHTLRGAIGWSHDLLDAGERSLFRRLGVFAGGFTLEAAQNTAPTGGEETVLDNLVSLVDKSLVQAQSRDGEGVRYRLLESVREYALEQLEIREEGEAARRAHALYYLELAERAEPELVGGEQRSWFLRLEAEHDNLRAAIEWLSSRGEDALALRLGAALGYFWWMCGHIAEGRRELGNLLELSPGGDGEPRTRALRNFGVLLLLHGEQERARAVLEDGLFAARSADDPRGVAVSLLCLGVCKMLGGDSEEGVSLLEESLARSRAAGYGWGAAWALYQLGVAAVHARDHSRARRLLEEARAEYRLVGDERGMAEALLWLGVALWRQGEVSQATALVRRVIGISRGFRDRRLLGLCVDVVLWQVGEGADPERVARLVGANEALHQVTGVRPEAFEHVSVAPAVAALGTRLDERSLAAARTEGHALSPDQMEKLALGVLDGAVGAGVTRGRPTVAKRRGLLSKRESEVLALVAEGLSNREISSRLFVTESTVRYHLANVFGKLGAGNRTQAVALAQRRNLL